MIEARHEGDELGGGCLIKSGVLKRAISERGSVYPVLGSSSSILAEDQSAMHLEKASPRSSYL